MARRSLPKADPELVAKRKRLIADQYLYEGKHATIKKTITWDDVRRGTGINGSSIGGLRLSESQTPGLSDKSYTPTPAARPLPSALKSTNKSRISITSSQPRLLSQGKNEGVLAPPIKQPAASDTGLKPPPKLPEETAPASHKTQPIPQAIDVDDNLPSDAAHQPRATVTSAIASGGAEHTFISDEATILIASPVISTSKPVSRPLFQPDSDDEVELVEKDDQRYNDWTNQRSPIQTGPSPVSSPDLGNNQTLAPSVNDIRFEARSSSLSPPPEMPTTHSATSNTPSPRPKKAPIRQHKRRSSVGIQTLDDGEKDWMGEELDLSMSAVNQSRIWASRSSPAKSWNATFIHEENVSQDQDGGDEPLGVSFLAEFEGKQVQVEMEHKQPSRAASVGPFYDAAAISAEKTSTGEPLLDEEPASQDQHTRHIPSTPEPIPLQDQSRSAPSSPDPVSIDHYAGMTEDIQQSEPYLPATSTGVYGEDFSARVSALRASVSQPINPQAAPFPFKLLSETSPVKPAPASQPVRSRSRMYTPQKLPGEALSAAPTLGRSAYEDLGGNNGVGAAQEARKVGNALRAAPTLGRSMLWDDVDAGEKQFAKTSEPNGEKGYQMAYKTRQHNVDRSEAASPSVPLSLLSRPSNLGDLPAATTKAPLVSLSQPMSSGAHQLSGAKSHITTSASQPQPSSRPQATTLTLQPGESIVAGPSTAPGTNAWLINAGIDPEDVYYGHEDGKLGSDQESTVPVQLSVGSREQSVKFQSDSAKANSAVTTDYDAEYGSVPNLQSNIPSMEFESESREHTHITVSSSPTNAGAWTLEPTRASTPQMQTQLPSTTAPILHVELSPPVSPKSRVRRPSLALSPNRPMSLATLGKRRRSSIAPLESQTSTLPPSKKIRREYDTDEPRAFPKHTRAHQASYDSQGNRLWVPHRPTMERAPEGTGTMKVVGPRRRVVDEESESEGHSEYENRQGNGVVHEGIMVQKHKAVRERSIEQEEHTASLELWEEEPETRSVGEPLEEAFTEIPETPQVGTIAGLAESVPEPLSLVDESSPSAVELAELVVNHSVPIAKPAPAISRPAHNLEPRVTPSHSHPRSRTSPFIPFSNKNAHSTRPKLKPERSGFQFTPARKFVQSPPRTRLSLGGRSGPSVLEVSESDQQILQQAGLKPTLKRLSQVHGFSTEIVADVYQEHGSLKDTEEVLEEMKRSAERTRAKIGRRKSSLFRESITSVLRAQEHELNSTDENEGGEEEDKSIAWDTTRARREILFGEGS